MVLKDRNRNIQQGDFEIDSPLWTQIVEEKFNGVNSFQNHHDFMINYVNAIAETLWEINGETDESRIENYLGFAYDLINSDTENNLVTLGLISQEDLNYYESLSNNVISNVECP